MIPPMLDSALALASRGIPVFPLRSNKGPCAEGGFKTATCDPAVIRRSFADPVAALIGVPTGPASGFDVLDIDPRNGGSGWLAEFRDKLPATVTHETRSGGRHYLFKHTPGMRNSASRIGAGVDMRGDGGYVVWWPAHGFKSSGTVWAKFPDWLLIDALRQINPLTPVPNAEELAPPDAAALLALLADMPNPDSATRDDYVAVNLAIQGCIRSLEALDRPVDTDAVYDAAAAWSASWDSGSASDFQAERVRWDDDWSRRDRDVSGWRHLLGLAGKFGMDVSQWTAAAAAAEFPDDLPAEPVAPVVQSIAKSDALRALLSIDSWMERDLPEPDRLLGDVLTTTTRVFLVGRTGLGKTLLGIALAAGVASGQGFLNWTSSRPARVLYLDGEMPAELIKPRAKDAVRRLGGIGIPDRNLLIFGRDIETEARRACPGLPPFAPLNTEGGRAFLLGLIDAIGDVDLIVFDNVMSLIAGDQKDEVPWSETLPLVASLTDRRIGQLWLDHTGHNSDRQYGSSTKAWRFDAVGCMTPVADEAPDPRNTAFSLSFDHPGKARRRTPDNWRDFEARVIRLQDDAWHTETLAPVRTGTPGDKLKPAAVAHYNALRTAIAASSTPGRTTKDDWWQQCVRNGLAQPLSPEGGWRDRDQKMKPHRARMSELKVAGWIDVDDEVVIDLKTSLAPGPHHDDSHPSAPSRTGLAPGSHHDSHRHSHPSHRASINARGGASGGLAFATKPATDALEQAAIFEMLE